ncbi:hypothetical protein SAMN05421829_1063 [Aromatoleum tolulyticum]|uniref:SMEK domain-containing protein n=1 Tax=Aromatoleum tolulyticum TaxID=34027 RepID=A0A1N6UQD6_9RHOO|nr:SMEK domain-containing protein [Aromatoleum tolulyticum]SIQ67809.1 hypothetical protein SAMN05421829_1063 [Aromatoleum tolulyticum]
MPLERARLFQNVVMKLSVLRYIVKSRSKRGHTDLNRDCETFFRDVLNMVYGFELDNLNESALNTAAIDLADEGRKLCVQVTATADAAKIKKTIELFIKHQLYKKYDTLVILMLIEKKDYRAKFETDGKVVFEPKHHVWDIDDIIAKAEQMSSNDLQQLSNFVDAQLPSVSQALEPASLLAQAEQITAKPPVSAVSFLKAMGNTPGTRDWKEELSGVSNLFDALCDLSRKQREFVAFILINGKQSGFFGRCVMSIQTVEQKLRLNRREAQEYFLALSQAGLIDVDDEGDAQNFELGFRFPSHADGFLMLKDYLMTADKIQKVIVNCDFTELD